MTNKMKP